MLKAVCGAALLSALVETSTRTSRFGVLLKHGVVDGIFDLHLKVYAKGKTDVSRSEFFEINRSCSSCSLYCSPVGNACHSSACIR